MTNVIAMEINMNEGRTSDDNFKILLGEINLILDRQHSDFDLLYNKLNWIVVSDFVFLAGVMSMHYISPLVVFFICLSVIAAFVGYSPKQFKSTQKIASQLDNVSNAEYVEELIGQKREAFNSNNKKYDSINLYLNFSKWVLVVSLVFQFFFLWLVDY